MRHIASAAVALCCFLFASAGRAGTLTPLYSPPGFADGSSPQSPLVRVGARLFGVSRYGGANNAGAVFSVDAKSVGKTGVAVIAHSFVLATEGGYPAAGLAIMGGKLFGTMAAAGGGAAVFEFDPASGAVTILGNLTRSLIGAPLLAYHGLLYGIGPDNYPKDSGIIFTVDPVAKTVKTIYSFPTSGPYPQYPVGALIRSGSKLYGTSSRGGRGGGGTLYSVEPKTGSVRTLFSFRGKQDGSAPFSSLLDVGGTLYGTTPQGGAANRGTVYSFDPKAKVERTLYSFTGKDDGGVVRGGLTSANGLLYGASESYGQFGNGTLFSVDPASGQEVTLHAFTVAEGSSFEGSMIVDDGILYGTLLGGPLADGTVFSFDPATAQESTLHIFAYDSFSGSSTAIKVGGSLYATSQAGGALGLGSIYKIDLATGEGKLVYSFAGKGDGYRPVAALVDVGGILYGTAYVGGVGGAGTVFGYDTATHTLTTLYGFSGGVDGGYPQSNLTAIDGLLYGTTSEGGVSNYGAVFSIDPANGAETVLHSFTSHKDGTSPAGALVQAGSLLYGTTTGGGSYGCGSLYSIDPVTSAEKLLYSFQGSNDGCEPLGAMVSDDGLLFGQTADTVFSFDPVNDTEKPLHSFKFGEGPVQSLIAVGKRLYGTIPHDHAAPYGAIISVNPATGRVDTLYDFADQTDGSGPTSSLLHVDGAFYGVSEVSVGSGTPPQALVFKFVP